MAVQKEIWQRTIVEGLFADNTFMAKAVNDDMYVNEGKKVHIPNAGAPSVAEEPHVRACDREQAYRHGCRL